MPGPGWIPRTGMRTGGCEPTWSGGRSPGTWRRPRPCSPWRAVVSLRSWRDAIPAYLLVPLCAAGLPYFPALRAWTPGSRSTASPPTAPPGPGAGGPLLQARGCLVVTGIAHGRRRVPPAGGCPVRLPHVLVGVAEVAQGLALAVPVAGLPEDHQRLLVAADGLLKPPQPGVGDAEDRTVSRSGVEVAQ